jgi:hypothetical protein
LINRFNRCIVNAAKSLEPTALIARANRGSFCIYSWSCSGVYFANPTRRLSSAVSHHKPVLESE